MSAIPPGPAAAADLLALTDHCVLCGLCLPACPTYRVAANEAESPRGRIALARALATGTLAPDGAGLQHLDQCLGCLSCERACPSGVRYGEIIDRSRALASRPPDRLQRLIYALIARPRWLRGLAWISHGLGLRHWLGPLARRVAGPRATVARWVAQIPPLPSATGLTASAADSRGMRGTVGLFLGCVASAFDRDTLAAARRLLSALGYTVVEPAAQGCCGALPRHAGHADVAAPLATATRRAFVDAGVDTVLVSASGCHGSLQDAFVGSRIAVREIGEFLSADTALHELGFTPLAATAALHVPCSLANGVRAAAATRALLARVPALRVAELPSQPRCCGAGGTHFLRYPAIADPLRDARLDQVEQTGADLLLTSNIGCRLHLGGGLRARGRAIDVMHPITLLARQLKAGTPTPTPLPSRPADAR